MGHDLSILMPAMARRAWAGIPAPTIRLGDWEWPWTAGGGQWRLAWNRKQAVSVFGEIPEALRAAIRDWCQSVMSIRLPRPRSRDLATLQATAVEIAMFPPSHPADRQQEEQIPPSPDPDLGIDWRAALLGLARGLVELGKAAAALQDGLDGLHPIRAPAPKIRPRPIGPAIWPHGAFDRMRTDELEMSVPCSNTVALIDAAWWLDQMGWDVGRIARALRELRAAARQAEQARQQWYKRAERLQERQAARLEALAARARQMGIQNSGWAAIQSGIRAMAERILRMRYMGAPLPPGLRLSSRPAHYWEGSVEVILMTDGPAACVPIDDFLSIAIACGWQAGRLEKVWRMLEKATERMERSIKDRK